MGSVTNDSAVAASNLFNVQGIVALVTGGGTGKLDPRPLTKVSLQRMYRRLTMHLRNWLDVDKSPCS